jgi:hypothetical protein
MEGLKRKIEIIYEDLVDLYLKAPSELAKLSAKLFKINT